MFQMANGLFEGLCLVFGLAVALLSLADLACDVSGRQMWALTSYPQERDNRDVIEDGHKPFLTVFRHGSQDAGAGAQCGG